MFSFAMMERVTSPRLRTSSAPNQIMDSEQHSAVVLFVDYDHDGDLDLFATDDQVKMYRNNGDGVFSDVSDQTFIPSERPGARDAALGDFDDDGDIDLLIVNDRGWLYALHKPASGKDEGIDRGNRDFSRQCFHSGRG